MARTVTVLAASLVLALSLAACSSTSGEASSGEGAAAGSNRPAASEPAEPAEPAEEAPAPAVNPKLGETFTYEDGLAVTIGVPAPYTPGEYAAGVEGFTSFLAFPVTIVNGTAVNFDPAMFHATVQSVNVEGSQVFDSGQGIEGSPSTTLLPGREAAFTLVFGVGDPADIVMEVSPGAFEYEPAIFTS